MAPQIGRHFQASPAPCFRPLSTSCIMHHGPSVLVISGATQCEDGIPSLLSLVFPILRHRPEALTLIGVHSSTASARTGPPALLDSQIITPLTYNASSTTAAILSHAQAQQPPQASRIKSIHCLPRPIITNQPIDAFMRPTRARE